MSVRPEQDYYKKPSVEQLNSDYGEKKKKRGKFNTAVTYFAESTSFIGIAKMWASPRIPFKVMWALFFLLAAGMLIYQLVKLIGLFSTFPVKTSVKLGFSPLPFPSVTICNMNPIRLSQAKQLSCELQKALDLQLDDQSEECATSNITFDFEDYRQTEIICPDEDDEDSCYEQEVSGLDVHYIRRRIIADYLTKESVVERIGAGHDIDTMLIECIVNGQTCLSQNFTWLWSRDLGNCYTFDVKGVRAKNTGPETGSSVAISNIAITSNVTSVTLGLSMVINLEPEEFISSFKTGYGLRVVVHSSGTRPFPDSEGFTVSAGAETSITVKMTEIVRLPDPHGNCNGSTAFKKKFGVDYTRRACQEFCVRSLIIDKCNCQPDTLESTSGSAQICDDEQDWQCQDETTDKYIADTAKGIDACTCSLPCNERVFESNIFSRSWPIPAHVTDLEKHICKNTPSSPKCGYDGDVLNNLRTSSFLKLKVYYETLNFEKVKEEPFYDVERFLSDIGGTMGLWMGASLLSVAEFIEIFMELLCCCFPSSSK